MCVYDVCVSVFICVCSSERVSGSELHQDDLWAFQNETMKELATSVDWHMQVVLCLAVVCV